MAAPTVAAVGAVAATATGGGTGPISPGLPSGFAADDIHVCFMESSSEPVTLISGWNLAGSGFVAQAGGLLTGLTVWWRRAVAGDTAPSITGAGDHLVARIIGIRGAASNGDPWDVTSYLTENVSDTSVSTPSVVTTGDDRLVFAAVATGQDTTTAQVSGSWTNASLSGVTTQMNNWSTTGNGGGFSVMTGALATQGTASASTATLATANFKALFSGALRPIATGYFNWYSRPNRPARMLSAHQPNA